MNLPEFDWFGRAPENTEKHYIYYINNLFIKKEGVTQELSDERDA